MFKYVIIIRWDFIKNNNDRETLRKRNVDYFRIRRRTKPRKYMNLDFNIQYNISYTCLHLQ